MIVGTLKVRLSLRECHSLKEKRRIISSLKAALSGKFNVAVAEVEEQDAWQSAEIGIVTVGTDTPFVQSVLSNVINYVRYWGGVQVVDHETETYGD
jgi:hypothetical protein